MWTSSLWAFPSLSHTELSQLKDGQVVIRSLAPSESSGVSVRAFGIVDGTPEEVWPVVRDCQHFKAFMPRTLESRLISRTGKTAVCFFKIDMPFPFDDLASSVLSTETRLKDGSFKRSWSLIKGSYRRNNGAWEVKPWQDGKALLIYFIDIDPNVKIPDFIIRKAQTGKLPEVFQAVQQRVRQLR